jgi:hypothetical protein
VPFVRYSRDRRGYTHLYLVHAPMRRGKPSRPRILYWFRTPPGVKVGRDPFDPEVRRRLEAQYPGVTFEWEKLAATPVPPLPEVEHWRERRRIEKAIKQARREAELDERPPADTGAPEEAPSLNVPDNAEIPNLEISAGDQLLAEGVPDVLPDLAPDEDEGEEDVAAEGARAPAATVDAVAGAVAPTSAPRRRRRRRRRRAALATIEALVPEQATVQVVTAEPAAGPADNPLDRVSDREPPPAHPDPTPREDV